MVSSLMIFKMCVFVLGQFKEEMVSGEIFSVISALVYCSSYEKAIEKTYSHKKGGVNSLLGK